MPIDSTITARDVFASTCGELLEIREKLAKEILEEAQKIHDVALSRHEASKRAEVLVKKGFKKFKSEVKQLFQVPPWSDIANMFLKTSKSKFFYSSLELLGEVERIIIGKPITESNEDGDWDWQ